MQQPMPNPEDITDPTTAMNMALVLMAKAFKLNYSTPTNNNQRTLSNPRNRQIAQPRIRMGIMQYRMSTNDAGQILGESIWVYEHLLQMYRASGLFTRMCTDCSFRIWVFRMLDIRSTRRNCSPAVYLASIIHFKPCSADFVVIY
ncbi:hypothetical protein Tco_0777523 [Tanacetum coccineum]